MPAAYARAFTHTEIAAHANIVARRGGRSAHAEACLSSAGLTVVCVVADDQPGLLSFVTDALLVHGLNVESAHVYCRSKADGKLEAVDFFWLKPALEGDVDASVDAATLADFAQTLHELIVENQNAPLASRERDTIPVPRVKPTRIYFDIEAIRRGEFVLVAQVPDFSGLLFAISSALHGQGVRIEASEIRTEGGIAKDYFYLANASSAPMDGERLCDIQQAVQVAVTAAVSRG